jgi:hypothetical protein
MMALRWALLLPRVSIAAAFLEALAHPLGCCFAYHARDKTDRDSSYKLDQEGVPLKRCG